MNIPISPKRFISQEERMRNLRIKPKQLAEIQNDTSEVIWYEDDNQPLLANAANWLYLPDDKKDENTKNGRNNRYFNETVDESRPLQDWKDHEASLGDKSKITQLYLEPNKYRFKDNKLVIKKEDYPNLKTLYACGVGLEKVELDCPTLENLYLNGNNLTQIDLSTTLNLQKLLVSNNEIKELNVNSLTHLMDLCCNGNQISSLNIFGLQNLCNLDASGQLREFVTFGIGEIMIRKERLPNLKLGNNPNLETIDIAENNIKNLNFPYLPSLKALSLRENGEYNQDSEKEKEQTKTLVLRSPNLELLDYHKSNIKGVIYHPDYPLESPDKLRIVTAESYTNPDGTHNPDAATPWEQLVYENQRQREQQALAEGRHIYADQECLDLSHLSFTNMYLNGENYPDSIKSINLGNNRLDSLFVLNFPNLECLNFAHNALSKEVKFLSAEEYADYGRRNDSGWLVRTYNLVVNCPKLKSEDLKFDSDVKKDKTVYGHKSHDPSRRRQEGEEPRVYDDKLDNPYQQKALVEDLLANPTNYTLPQIEQQLNFEQVPPMERGVLLELLKTKAEAQEEQAWAALCARFSLDKVEEEKQQLEQEEQQLKKEEEEAEATTSQLAQAKTEVHANIQQLLEENDLTASDLPPSYQQWEQQLQTCHSEAELKALQQQLCQAITEPTPVASSRHTVAWWGGLMLSLFLVGYGLWRKLEKGESAN